MVSRIPQTFIDDLLARCDIVEIIDARIPLKKSGNNYTTRCPFHTEKTPSFSVSAIKQFYYCFGCGASGNAISFLMAHEHMEFTEAITALANQVGLQIPHQTIQQTQTQQTHQTLHDLLLKITKYYQRQLRQSSSAIDYLKQRGISGQIAKDFGIGFSPVNHKHLLKHFGTHQTEREQLLACGMLIQKEGDNLFERFRDRIMFPIRDRRGRVIGFGGRTIGDATPKYLNSPETLLFHKGNELYGLYEARCAQRELPRLLVVEGYMDLIALVQHGISNTVATLGTAITDNHLKLLFRCTQEIIFCFDGDIAGKKAAWRALEIALPLLQDGLQINFIFLPEGEDPDSIIRKEGATQFQQRMINATPLSEFFFNHIGAELNLNHLDGKARLAKPASLLLSKIPPSVFQLRMFQRLAQIVRVEPQQLYSLAGIKHIASPRYQKPISKTATIRLTPIQLATTLLCQNPELAQTIADIPALMSTLSELMLPDVPLLRELLELLQKQPQMTTGMLLEHWRFYPNHAQIIQLMNWQHTIPENGIHHELHGVLQRLQQLNQEQKIEQLLRKANQQGLSAEEKLLLQKLIATTKA